MLHNKYLKYITVSIFSGLILGLGSVFGLLPLVGLITLLFCCFIVSKYNKIYHLAVLTGVVMLSCVVIEPSPADLLLFGAIPIGLITGVFRPIINIKNSSMLFAFTAYFIFSLFGIAVSEDFKSSIVYFLVTFYLFLIAVFLSMYCRNKKRAIYVRILEKSFYSPWICHK